MGLVFIFSGIELTTEQIAKELCLNKDDTH
ncbi:Uncharacterised protein [Legionella cincinnatiensis]|uniref:Uncharacterized protein n=1 Tax=Legionella cincinnatiensis TaxID=28085 RepID=A0A378IG93_9GAMM|nr:Uncharacterised protein [Legionella cincinnatiensis]